MNHFRSAACNALLLGFLLSAAATQADQVYKSVDVQGHVVYSDRATTPTAQKSTVNVTQGDPSEAARTARQTSTLKAEDEQRKRQQSLESHDKAQRDHETQVRCQNARNRYYALKDANVLYTVDAQGKRQIFSDTEADAHKEQLHQAMVAACGK